MMTPVDDDNKVLLGEDCSSTRSDDHSHSEKDDNWEADNNSPASAVDSSPGSPDDIKESSDDHLETAGADDENNKDSSNASDNNNDNKICEGENSLREETNNKSDKDDEDSKPCETLLIQKKNSPPPSSVGSSGDGHGAYVVVETSGPNTVPCQSSTSRGDADQNQQQPEQQQCTDTGGSPAAVSGGGGSQNNNPRTTESNSTATSSSSVSSSNNLLTQKERIANRRVGANSRRRRQQQRQQQGGTDNNTTATSSTSTVTGGGSNQYRAELPPPSNKYWTEPPQLPPPSTINRNNRVGTSQYRTEPPPPLPPNRNNNIIVNNPLPANYEPMAMPSTPPRTTGSGSDVLPPEASPGAYSGTHGRRIQKLDFSLMQQPPADSLGQARIMERDLNGSLEVVEQGEQQQQLSNLDSGSTSNHHHRGLVEALPVGSASFYYHSSRRILAQPVNQDNLDQQHTARRKAKEREYKRIACGIVVLACLVLMVSFAVRFTKTKNNDSTNAVLDDRQTMPTLSPTRPLPPMDHLELLYDELPQKTKESLYNIDSPQYQAWEWLLNHPNVASYPEWRKKQVFAMTTFFYSFEGQNWPEQIQTRWLNVTTDECSWVMTDFEIAFFAQESANILGDAYDLEDYRPCNQHGQLQTLLVHQLFLPTGTVEPVMPPEIGLLTSLRILAIIFSQIGGKLSEMIVPELMELPNLLQLNFQRAGISGTIPTSIGMMKQLKSLVLGGNDLSGSIPTEIGEMTLLEFYTSDRSAGQGLNGRLPTELGLLTQLTALSFKLNSLTGQIPSQIGLLTRIRALGLRENKLNGSLPSQLGLLERMTHLESSRNLLTSTIPTELASLSNMGILYLGVNLLTAEIPSEIGLMTNMKELWLGNNALVGGLPSQLGEMSNLVELWLGNDLIYTGSHANFTGSFPRELWELSNLEVLYLPHLPNLSGSIPTEIMMPNLTMLSLSGSPRFSGTIPDQACLFIGELDFDCSDMLCGCDCPCVGRANGTNPQG